MQSLSRISTPPWFVEASLQLARLRSARVFCLCHTGSWARRTVYFVLQYVKMPWLQLWPFNSSCRPMYQAKHVTSTINLRFSTASNVHADLKNGLERRERWMKALADPPHVEGIHNILRSSIAVQSQMRSGLWWGLECFCQIGRPSASVSGSKDYEEDSFTLMNTFHLWQYSFCSLVDRVSNDKCLESSCSSATSRASTLS